MAKARGGGYDCQRRMDSVYFNVESHKRASSFVD